MCVKSFSKPYIDLRFLFSAEILIIFGIWTPIQAVLCPKPWRKCSFKSLGLQTTFVDLIWGRGMQMRRGDTRQYWRQCEILFLKMYIWLLFPKSVSLCSFLQRTAENPEFSSGYNGRRNADCWVWKVGWFETLKSRGRSTAWGELVSPRLRIFWFEP